MSPPHDKTRAIDRASVSYPRIRISECWVASALPVKPRAAWGLHRKCRVGNDVRGIWELNQKNLNMSSALNYSTGATTTLLTCWRTFFFTFSLKSSKSPLKSCAVYCIFAILFSFLKNACGSGSGFKAQKAQMYQFACTHGAHMHTYTRPPTHHLAI